MRTYVEMKETILTPEQKKRCDAFNKKAAHFDVIKEQVIKYVDNNTLQSLYDLSNSDDCLLINQIIKSLSKKIKKS